MDATEHNATPGILKLIAFYKQMGTPVYYRPEEKYIEMLKPWRLEGGFLAFLDWHGLDESFMTDEDLKSAGPGGGGYGAYLIK